MSFIEFKCGFGIFVLVWNLDFIISLCCVLIFGVVLCWVGFVLMFWYNCKYFLVDVENGVWYYDNFVVFYWMMLLVVFFEVGVIKYWEEELELFDLECQVRMVDVLVIGIVVCFYVKEKLVWE